MVPHTVLLIDDHALFRKGVAQLIQMNPSFEVTGEATSGQDGIEMAVRLKPDVVLIDLNMPRMNGIETLEGMRQAGVDARFIMLTVSDNERDVVAALRAGAHGYLLKDMDPEDLCVSLQKALKGTAVLSESVTGSLVHALSGGQRIPAAQNDLTARELEVFDYLVAGLCNKAIARKLDISVGTVKVHVKHVLRKLDLHSRLEAVLWQQEHGSRSHH
ncbi:two-component system response regulator NarL [Paraburkholderia phymatum]|uniref:Two component transcriptional regulator, LuxR family n=1 Tax=Paraburkholderia phymatum (strain DSM 17167 / CIP 108236 / LMG 21445 / STM815) TaxID=391038 RepID=B2JVP2_PARP8|nr:two-component system response regulator NarL [Paraburkholderia phymatum]ACC75019.1 two component transcriptional regulator, LuxR family [Paraburkholderia phymatum STM815]